MQQLILILHILVALSILALVLVQHGKGADVGASFGSGAANTMFGSVGPASFLMKLTGILAAIFFATSILLVYIGGKNHPQVMQFNAPTQTTVPSSTTAPQTTPMPTMPSNPENSFAPSTAPSSSPATTGTKSGSQ